ncbi:MAG: tRNA pseudouridine(13) synthase TruD [Candidatus Micrarchaeota archaeon]
MGFEPEEFVVEEIAPDGTVLEIGKELQREDEEGATASQYFARFVLQKRLWTTPEAMRAVAARLGVSQKRLGAAGNKDRNAVTTQMCSAFAVEPERVRQLRIKDISINGAWRSGKKVGLGDLAGNRFTVTLNEKSCGKRISAAEILADAEKNGYAVPNYFGSQRFGSTRRNTHLVGRLLLEGRHEDAVMAYLCAPGDTNLAAARARRDLSESRDFRQALAGFPRHLKFERRMIAHLALHPGDFLGAFRRLHRSSQLLFVHAVQSWLFNRKARMRADDGTLLTPRDGDRLCMLDGMGFPDADSAKKIPEDATAEEAGRLVSEGRAVLAANIIGYASELTADENALLAAEGISKEFFRPRSMPELSSKGALRPLFVFLRGFEARDSEDGVVARFSLPSGSYATVALDELLGNQHDVF